MKKLIFLLISLIGFVINGIAYSAITDPSFLDQKGGDTVIYGGGSTAVLQPNVLIIFDNSGSMSGNANPSSPYNRTTTYTVTNSCEGDTQPCDSAWVYRLVAQGVEGKWVKHILLSSVYNSGGNNCRTTLNNTGRYNGRLNGASGQCGSGINATYATGNWINWLNTPGTQAYPKIEVAKKVVRDLIQSTSGVKFGLMLFNNNQGGYIAFPVSDMTKDACSGTNCDYLDENATATAVGTNQKALLDVIGDPGQDLPSSGSYNDLYNYSDDSPLGIQPTTWTPLAESLFEAMRYYSGGASAFPNNPTTHTTPIEYSCQKNYVILITDGMSTQDRDNVLQTICNNGDCDGDGPEVTTQGSQGSDYLDDVAWYMYNTDLLPDGADAKTTGKQNVITYTIGFGLTGGDSDAVQLLQDAATNGGGTAYLASDISTLSSALTEIFANIMAANTSFVSPVVPVNPENKVYSGERVYIGFFKPSGSAFWGGNIKKYGLRENSSGDLEITDKDGNLATNSDGSFRDNSISFWGTTVDGGQVEAGGVGIQLYNRATARNIYTYLGANSDLTNSVNAFTTTNTNITYSILGVADNTAKDNLIKYVHGEDSYDNPGAKRNWILGDVLHSKPLVVQYAKYTFTSSNEANCSTNKSIIYVGANDGMIHAFKDCDGSELWAFIPPDKLAHLQYLSGSAHTYFVDGSPKAYIYDKNKDGNINATDDKVILIFGERRGGQYYYALDVTDSANPKFMWRFGNGPQAGNKGLLRAGSATVVTGSDSWFTEMWETFSDPVIDRIQLGSSDKRAAMFIGAGYDNDNQDLEPPSIASADTKGRGVYAIEIGKITGSGLDIANSGAKLWGYTNANNSSMTHSIPSPVAAIDADDNSYIDRLYVGDTGGKVWRLDVKGATSDWKGRLLFSSNTGSSERRKIFYESAVTYESDSNNKPFEMVFFGTGDREHPVRTNKDNTTNPIQIDRMYGVKDKAQTYTIMEGNLTDVTEDRLQAAPGTSTSEIACLLSRLGWGESATGCDEQDGWYIKLDENNASGSLREEKVLAAVTVYSGGVYYPTYSPEAEATADVCTAGKEGTARLYGVHWRTGEAIENWDTTNDSTSTTNERAMASDGTILLRSDRVKTVGSGIPSKVTSGGLIGVGGKIVSKKLKDEDLSNIIYWRELF